MSYSPNPQDVRFSDQKTVFQDEITVKNVEVSFQLDNGSWAPALPRHFLATGPKVAVLPFDPYENKVVFIESFRIGTLNQPEGPWHLELPTRLIKSKDHAEEVQRALKHDIAVEGLDVEYIGDFYTAPSLSTEKVYLFCAGIDSSQVVSQGRIEVLTVSDALDAVYSNYFRDASTIIALHWLLANQTRLQQKWQ